MSRLISSIQPDHSNMGMVLNELIPLLGSSSDAPREFVAAFERVVFPPVDPEDVAPMQISIAHYMDVLSQLPEPYKAFMRNKEGITPPILKHLTAKRGVDSSRSPIIWQCEAYAWLTANQFVTLQGSLNTLVKMLGAEGTRCAAVTMLGKTVEYCAAEITKLPADTQHKLCSKVAETVTESQFAYDVAYVVNSLGWPPQMFNQQVQAFLQEQQQAMGQ